MHLQVLMVACALCTINAYELGAPKEACSDMIPQHHTPPQTSPLPYTIHVEKTQVKGGEKVNIIISGTEEAKNFKGFFVQARVGNIPIGKFDAAPDVKLVDCGDSQAVSSD